MFHTAAINIRIKLRAICSNCQRRNGFKNARLYPASIPCRNSSDITKHPLNSKPIPQIDSTNYLALIGRSCSVKIRCQTFSAVMGEPDRIFWYLLLDMGSFLQNQPEDVLKIVSGNCTLHRLLIDEAYVQSVIMFY